MWRRLADHRIVAFVLVVVLGVGIAAYLWPGEAAPVRSSAPASVSVGGWTVDWGQVALADQYIRGVRKAIFLRALAEAQAARDAAASRSRGSCDRPVNYGAGQGQNDAIPSEIVRRESNGNYGACNESSGACGKYQFLDSTWNNYGGYQSACDAPPAVQDQKARETWAGGAGCQHWASC